MMHRVILSAGNIAHYHHAALALHKAGLLARYLCTFDGTEANAWWGNLLPADLRKRLQGKVLQGIPPRKVQTIPLPYLAVQSLRKLNLISANKTNLWFSAWYDRASARHIGQAEVFHYVGSMGWKTAQTVKKRGGVTICDVRSEHIDSQEAILRQEYAQMGLPYQSARSLLRTRLIAEYRDSDAVLVPSGYVQETLVQHGIAPDKIFTVPYGADLAPFARWQKSRVRAINDETFRILFVGQIIPRKGLHYLIQAFNALRLPRSKVLVFGRGESAYQHLLQAMIPAGETRIRFLGHIPQIELWRHYQQADVFVLPTISEGSALVVYEAMAAGLPVVTTPNAGSVIRDGEDGFIVPIRDADALAEKLVWLYERPEARRTMGANAAQRVQDFTWERYGERLVEVYRQILGQI